MGLKETIQAAVTTGFTALGNLKESVTYKGHLSTSSYVAATGQYVRNESSTAIEGIFLDYAKRDIDGQQIKPHDQKFLVLQSQLIATPTLQDRIIRSTGAIWEVIAVSEDPAHATWELQMRATNG